MLAQVDYLTLEDILLKNKFKENNLSDYKFIKQGERYITLKNNHFLLFDTKLGVKMDSIKVDFQTDSIADFEYQEQADLLLLKYRIEHIYRRSVACEIALYNMKTKEAMKPTGGDLMVNPAFSANGKYLAFTKSNNLYYYDIANQKLVQVTFDGLKNKIINGQSDWVYEEEFSFTKAYWWNSDASKIAYLKFDESGVKTYTLQYWNSGIYPNNYEYKYPKVGESSSKVSLWVYDLKTQKHDSIAGTQDSYLPRVGWSGKDLLFYYAMNRFQNRLEIFKVLRSEKSLIYKEESKTYVDLDDEAFHDDKFLYLTSEQSGYKHIYKIGFFTNKSIAVTNGNWDVVSIEGLAGGKIYYTHTKFHSYAHTLAFSDVSNFKMRDYNREGSAKVMTLSEKYIIVSLSNLLSPPSYQLLSNNLDSIKILLAQNDLMDKLSKLSEISTEFLDIDLGDHTVSTLVLKPKILKQGSRYPTLIYQYSGPGYQVVVDEWKSTTALWFRYLIDKGFIVVMVDPRGTGGRGEAFKKSTYLRLGLLESEDMALVSKKMSQRSYIDTNQINIFGWSFGGYVSALCASKWSRYFNKAVSIAPVIDWRYYDNIYTERYMQTPQTNPKGYDTSSVLKYCDLMNSKLLLLHGTADDNVHIQNSYQFQKCLMANNKLFDFFVFTDKNHSIYGRNTRYYLYRKVTDFLLKN